MNFSEIKTLYRNNKLYSNYSKVITWYNNKANRLINLICLVHDKKSFIYYAKVPAFTKKIGIYTRAKYDITFNRYDVLIEIISKSETPKIINGDFKLFCNSPGFIFNYNYIFNKNNMLTDLVDNDKFSQMALNIKPSKTNPSLKIGVDSTIYLILHHIIKNKIYLIEKFRDYNKSNKQITLENIVNKLVPQEEVVKAIKTVSKNKIKYKRKEK